MEDLALVLPLTGCERAAAIGIGLDPATMLADVASANCTGPDRDGVGASSTSGSQLATPVVVGSADDGRTASPTINEASTPSATRRVMRRDPAWPRR